MEVIFFPTPLEFRKWLKKYHQKETELFVGFYKKAIGKPTMTWSQSVDQALCFGWIDGIRRSIDQESYCNRFTPRKSKSNWSAINIKKVEYLTQSGQMTPAGLKAFELRKVVKTGVYYTENKNVQLSESYQKQFKKNKIAWKYFNAQTPSYKKLIVHWIMSAKQEKTRMSRLEKAILSSEDLKRIQ